MVIDDQMQLILETEVLNGMPGVVAALADSNGVLWQGTAGVSDLKTGTKIEQSHLFGIGSITKTYIAVLVHQLAEEGQIRYDQSARDILGANSTQDIANAETANISQLLNHSSGIQSWEDDPIWIRDARGANLNISKNWAKFETLDYIRGQAPLFEPGKYYSYSNTNHTILGLIIETVTGNDLITELRKRVLSPIGANSTFLEGFETYALERAASRYHHATAEFERQAGISPSFEIIEDGIIDVNETNLSVEWAAGGLVSSSADLIRFATALRNGELLGTQSMRRLQEWSPSVRPDGVRSKHLVGQGIFKYDTPGGYFLGHGGSVLGYTANLFWHETVDLMIVILSNIGAMHAGQNLSVAHSIGEKSAFPGLALDFAARLTR